MDYETVICGLSVIAQNLWHRLCIRLNIHIECAIKKTPIVEKIDLKIAW